MNEIFKLFGTVAINGVDEAEREIDGLTSTAAASENKLVSGFKKIGAAVVAAFAVDKIISFGQSIVEAAATVSAEQSAFAQIMGDYADEATEKMSGIADAVGMADTRLTPYMTSMTAKFKGLGYDVEDATSFATRGLTLAADAAAFWDKSLDESMSHLNSFINGSYEGGEAIGLFANDTQMAMYAVEQGIVSSKSKWKDLDEATKQATRLEYAENMMKLSGAVGQAAKESGQFANSSADLTEKWRQFKAQIGEPILQNVVVPVMQMLCDLIDTLSAGYEKCSTWIAENQDTVDAWVAVIVGATATVGTFLLVLNWGEIMAAAAAALHLVTSSIHKMTAAIAANQIGAIVSLVVGLISTLVYLYNTNEEFKAFVDGMLDAIWTKIQVVIGWIQENVLPVIQEIIGWVQANVMPVIQKIIGWLEGKALEVLQTVIEWIQGTALPAIQEFMSWLGENGLATIQKVIAWIQENVIPVVQEVIAWIKDVALPAIQEFIGWLWDNAIVIIQNVISWIRENVLPVVQEIIAWIKDVALPAIQEFIGWLGENVLPVIQGIISWVSENIIPAIRTVIGWLSDKIGAFWSWLTESFSSTGESVGGIWEKIKGFFSGAWDFIVGIWQACQPFFDGVWNGIILPVWGLIQEMIGAFQMAWDVIVLLWGYAVEFFGQVWEGIKFVFSVVSEVLGNYFSAAWEVIKFVWSAVQPYFSAIWEAIKAVFSVVGTVLGAFFKNAWEAIKLVWGVAVEFFKLIWGNIKAVFSVVVAVLGGFFRTAWEVIKAVWSGVIAFFTMVWAGIKAVFAVVKGVLSGDFSDAWAAIKNVWDKAKSFFSIVWSGIKNVFSAVGSWFGNTFKAAWSAIKNVFSNWGSFFSGLWDKITNTFSKIGTNISNAIGKAVKSGINGVISMIEGTINTAVNIINGAIDLINLIPGVDIGHVSDVNFPRLAKGGVVTSPTVAQIGEDGAEAVVPLERNTQWIDLVAAKVAEQSGASVLDDLLELLSEYLPLLLGASQRELVADDGAIIARYVPMFNRELGKISARKERGR